MPVGATATLLESPAKLATLAASQPQTATIARQVGAVRAPPSATVATVPRQTVKPLLLAQPQTVSNGLGNQKFATLATTVHAGATPPGTKTLTCSSTAAATLAAVKTFNRTLSATQTQTPLLARQAAKTVRAGTGMALPPIFTSVSPVPSLTAQKIQGVLLLSTTTTASAVANKSPAKQFALTSNTLPSLSTSKLQKLKTLTTSTGQSATFVRQAGKLLPAPSATVATVQKAASTHLAAAAAAATSPALQAGKRQFATLTGVSTATATAAPVFVLSPGALLIIPISGPGTLTFTPAATGTLTLLPANPPNLGLINPVDPSPR